MVASRNGQAGCFLVMTPPPNCLTLVMSILSLASALPPQNTNHPSRGKTISKASKTVLAEKHCQLSFLAWLSVSGKHTHDNVVSSAPSMTAAETETAISFVVGSPLHAREPVPRLVPVVDHPGKLVGRPFLRHKARTGPSCSCNSTRLPTSPTNVMTFPATPPPMIVASPTSVAGTQESVRFPSTGKPMHVQAPAGQTFPSTSTPVYVQTPDGQTFMLQPTGRKRKSVSKVPQNSAKRCLGTAGQNFRKCFQRHLYRQGLEVFVDKFMLASVRKIKNKFIATEERTKAAIITETTISIQCERDAHPAILRSQERFCTL